VPQRGRIGIFNRSYYEEVLVVRVHQELLKAQKMPPELIGKSIWDERLADIARFEDYLTRQGVVILKFYLNLSYKEQKKRFLNRLDKPDKNWKFTAADVRERRYWDNYMELMTRQFAPPPQRPRHGSSCPPTTNGSRVSSSRRLSPAAPPTTCAPVVHQFQASSASLNTWSVLSGVVSSRWRMKGFLASALAG